MRRFAALPTLFAACLGLATPAAWAAPPKAAPAAAPRQAAAPANAPPHAWLFGTWTGGLFPAASGLSAQACLAQPVVIFTQDVVLRATLMDVAYTQRTIQTVRGTGNGVDFQFVPTAAPANTLMGAPGAAAAVGFGCPGADSLHVERHGPNEITFPGCADFPNPLVRCPG